MYVTAYDPPVSWTTRTTFVGDAILVSFITDDWTTWGRVVNCITSSALARATRDTPTPATAIRRVTFVINVLSLQWHLTPIQRRETSLYTLYSQGGLSADLSGRWSLMRVLTSLRTRRGF